MIRKATSFRIKSLEKDRQEILGISFHISREDLIIIFSRDEIFGLIFFLKKIKKRRSQIKIHFISFEFPKRPKEKYPWRESNPQPSEPEYDALPLRHRD